MTREADDLLKKALTLPAEDRAALAGSLINSLDTEEEASAQSAWNDEIAQRIEELDSGEVKAISWDVVRQRVTNKLNGK